MKYLIALDMEGVHGVLGEPYARSVRAIGFETEAYAQAVASATQEVNVAVNALFESGATEVYLWDNHAARDNVDFSKIDGRAKKIILQNGAPRMWFLDELHFDGVLFLGYHSRAGSINGILAHTYNGMDIQYYKIAGKQVGEFDMDAWIAAEYGVPAIFAASDDVCVRQISEHSPQTVTVVTKYGRGRRKGILRDEKDVLQEIGAGIKTAANAKILPEKLLFPCSFEIRYTSMDFAEIKFEELNKKIPVSYGEDAHTLQATLQSIDDLRIFI